MRTLLTRASVFGTFSILAGLFFASVAVAAIVAGSSSTNVSNIVSYTQLSLSQPAGVVTGDLLLANVTVNSGASTPITAPSGWTLIKQTSNGNDITVATYYKVAGNAEPSNYSWTIQKLTKAIGGITRVNGVDTANPIDTSSGSTGKGKSAVAPSVTTSSVNEQIVAVYAMDWGLLNSGYFATPLGMTENYDVTNTPAGPSLAMDSVTQATTGASGSKTSAIASAIKPNWVAQTIALRPAPTASLLPGLVSYWKLDESSGDASDSKGVNTLTNNNSVTYSIGKIGNGANFSTSSTQYLSISDSSQTGLGLTNSITMSAWVKFESLPTSDQEARYIVSKWKYGSNDSPSYALALWRNPVAPTLYLFIRSAHNTEWVDIAQYWTPKLDTWYYVTGTWDGTGSVGKIYVDGVQLGTNTNSIGTGIQLSDSEFRIGAGENTSGEPFKFQDGMIDEVGVWNRALSSTEISGLYNGGAGLPFSSF